MVREERLSIKQENSDKISGPAADNKANSIKKVNNEEAVNENPDSDIKVWRPSLEVSPDGTEKMGFTKHNSKVVLSIEKVMELTSKYGKGLPANHTSSDIKKLENQHLEIIEQFKLEGIIKLLDDISKNTYLEPINKFLLIMSILEEMRNIIDKTDTQAAPALVEFTKQEDFSVEGPEQVGSTEHEVESAGQGSEILDSLHL